MINVFEPYISFKDALNVFRNVKQKNISGSSPVVKEFEQNIAKKFDRKYAISLSNGSVALDLSFQLLKLSSDDEVILPSHTIISCLSAVVRSGAKPVFCDVDSDTWNMTLENIKKVKSKKTKVVLMVHTFGLPGDALNISDYCKENQIILIEDSAEAHGQYENGIKCGSFGLISTFSFYANKHITTGEGGCLLTDSEEIYLEAIQMRNLDFNNKNRFKTNNLYWNYRMGGLQASLGISQINKLDTIIKKKIAQGNIYQELLSSHKNILKLPLIEHNNSINHYWVFGVVLKTKGIRDILVNNLYELGIETRPFFWPLHLQPSLPEIYKNQKFDLSVSENIGMNGLYLPMGGHVNKKDQKEIVSKLVSEISNI